MKGTLLVYKLCPLQLQESFFLERELPISPPTPLVLLFSNNSKAKTEKTQWSLFCVLELEKILAKRSSDPRELQVVEAMEDICQTKYFSKYDYSPPTTVKACRFLIGKSLLNTWAKCSSNCGNILQNRKCIIQLSLGSFYWELKV